MQKSVGRVEWVGTSVGVTDGLGGVKEQVIVRTPPSQVLHLLPTVSHCGVGGERGFRMRVEETCWGLLVRKLSIWADLVSFHSQQSIQGARCFTPLEEFGGCIVSSA